jgi:multiple sugar transport system substrate-binding protein
MSTPTSLTRRTLLQGASLATVSLLVGRGDAPVAAQSEQVTLRVWHVEKDELQPVIDAFTAKNPNVKIEFQYYPWDDFWDKLNAAYAAGDPPDVHRQDDDEIPFFAQKGTLLPLDEAVAGLGKDALMWNILDSVKVNGKLLVSVPAFRVGNFVYNKTLFEDAGVPLPPATYPSDDWTWDTFADTCRKLSKPDEMQFGVAGIDSMDFVSNMARSNGGEVLSEDCLTFHLGDPPAVEVMQKIADLILKDKAAADPETQQAFGGFEEMFNQGRLGLVFADTRFAPPDDVGFEWGYAGWPIFSGKKPVDFAAVECFGVPAVTKHPKEATAFATFLMGEEAQQILATSRNIIPINPKAAEEWVTAGKVNRQLLLDAAPYGKALPFAVGWGRVQDLTWPIFGEIFLGQKSVEDAVAEAVPLANTALQEAGGCLGKA